MRANAVNVRRAGILLRAMAGKAGWMPDLVVDARAIAKDKAIVGTEAELVEVESYMVDQGWIRADDARGVGHYALMRHGLDEAQRKLPAEPKVYTPKDDSSR